MNRTEKREKKLFNKKNLAWMIPLAVVIIFAVATYIYSNVYYRADESVALALKSDENVTVTEEDFGWFFDGPSEGGKALIFYPGGKVEETAYAPMLRTIAENAADVFLVKAPMKLAIFAYDKAGEIIRTHEYEHWFIAGHSLGGTAASFYAAENGKDLDALILLASYSTEELPEGLKVLSVRGSEDGILNMKQYENCKKNLPDGAQEYVIEGGNHCGFGLYGHQRGDGEALISASEQSAVAAEQICKFIISVG